MPVGLVCSKVCRSAAAFLLLGAGGLLADLPEPADNTYPPVVPLSPEEIPEVDLWFDMGEKLTYKVYWGFIPVGTSKITTEWVSYKGQKLIAIRFRTKSNSVLSKIYPVDDLVESLIDPETFLPVRFTKRLSEGRYRCDETTHFDHEAGTARRNKNLPGKEGHEDYEINDQTRDIVTFLYYVREKGRDLDIGEERIFKVMADEKLYDLSIKPVEEETVKLPHYGKVESIRYEPDASFQGIFVRKGRMILWASPDERRILTKIQAEVPVASVKILLANVEGPGEDSWIKNQARPEDLEDDDTLEESSSPLPHHRSGPRRRR